MLYTKDVTLTTTALTSLFTVPSGFVAHVTDIALANHSGSTRGLTLYWDKATGTDFYFYDDVNISDGALSLLEVSIILQPGDQIQAHLDAAGDFGIAVTFDLYPQPQQLVAFN